MSVEIRNGNAYYYRKKRIGNRVTSEYVGKDEFAFLYSFLDQTEREKRKCEADKLKVYLGNVAEVDGDLSELETSIKSLVEKTLLRKGFYKTKSRQWRLKSK
jgi:hypothetical protein